MTAAKFHIVPYRTLQHLRNPAKFALPYCFASKFFHPRSFAPAHLPSPRFLSWCLNRQTQQEIDIFQHSETVVRRPKAVSAAPENTGFPLVPDRQVRLDLESYGHVSQSNAELNLFASSLEHEWGNAAGA